jgi:hypothetical protein
VPRATVCDREASRWIEHRFAQYLAGPPRYRETAEYVKRIEREYKKGSN